MTASERLRIIAGRISSAPFLPQLIKIREVTSAPGISLFVFTFAIIAVVRWQV